MHRSNSLSPLARVGWSSTPLSNSVLLEELGGAVGDGLDRADILGPDDSEESRSMRSGNR
jgi:hypothetical protein